MDTLTILTPDQILALPAESWQQTRAQENAYRRGFSHGFEKAIQLLQESKSLGYSRPSEIANMLDHYHRGPVLRWRHDKRLERPAPFPFIKWAELRAECLRQDPTCVWCGSTENLHADHVAEVREGGIPTLENLQTLCAKCHTEKTTAFYHFE